MIDCMVSYRGVGTQSSRHVSCTMHEVQVRMRVTLLVVLPSFCFAFLVFVLESLVRDSHFPTRQISRFLIKTIQSLSSIL